MNYWKVASSAPRLFGNAMISATAARTGTGIPGCVYLSPKRRTAWAKLSASHRGQQDDRGTLLSVLWDASLRLPVSSRTRGCWLPAWLPSLMSLCWFVVNVWRMEQNRHDYIAAISCNQQATAKRVKHCMDHKAMKGELRFLMAPP